MSECQNLIKNANAIGEEFPLDKVMSNRMVDKTSEEQVSLLEVMSGQMFRDYTHNSNTDLIFDVNDQFEKEKFFPENVHRVTDRDFGHILARGSIFGVSVKDMGGNGGKAYRSSHPGIQIMLMKTNEVSWKVSLVLGAFIDHDEDRRKYRLLVPMLRTANTVLGLSTIHCFGDSSKTTSMRFVEPWSYINEDIQWIDGSHTSWLQHIDGFVTVETLIGELKGNDRLNEFCLNRYSLSKYFLITILETSLGDIRAIYPELFISED